jgi:hypothetical protein
MPLSYDDITAITQKYFVAKLVDNIFNSNAGLSRSKKKWYTKIGGGERIVQPLLYATNGSSEWYAGGTLNVTSNAKKTAAEYEWKMAHAAIVINDIDELKNSGDAQIISHVKSEVQVAEKTLSNTLGTAIFSDGSTANSIQGFKLGCAITGTCGAIAKATYSWWEGHVDSTPTAITLPKLQALYGDCSIDSDKPTVIFCTQDIWDDIWGLIQPQQRFGDQDTIKAGFNNILWNGIPVIVDSHVDSGYLYMINENYIDLKVHKSRDFSLTGFDKPVNQDTSYAHIFWAGAMTYSNCRMLGMMSALT